MIPDNIIRRLDETGIGFAGVDGHWWRPACEPCKLPGALARQLEDIGPAIFHFFDVLLDLCQNGSSEGLSSLLAHKVPPEIPRLVSHQRLDSLRPDFQLCPISGSSTDYHLVITELEVCPSAHGFAHAMQLAYGLPTDLVDGFAAYLNGRDLLFAGTQAWSEFLFEQLVFCRALADQDIHAQVLYDMPLSTLAKEVYRGQRWQPPLFGIPTRTEAWDENVIERLKRHGLETYFWPDDSPWPKALSNTVVFRFGYFDTFSDGKMRQFQNWASSGARSLNPPTFFFENKAVMAALNLPEVREQIASDSLAILDDCIPETILLTPENQPRLLDEQEKWVLKYAAYDGGNQAWGGRSLEFGSKHTAANWRSIVEQYLALPWPVVAQRLSPTAQFDMCYFDEDDNIQLMVRGQSRLRVFLLRDPQSRTGVLPGVKAYGAHITLSKGHGRVSEGLESVQAPVLFS